MPRGRPPKLPVIGRPTRSHDKVVDGQRDCEPIRSPGTAILGDFLDKSTSRQRPSPATASKVTDAPSTSLNVTQVSSTSIPTPVIPATSTSTKKPYIQALKSSSKGMALSFVEGLNKEVVIDEEDIASEVDYWSCTLVGTVMGRQTSIVKLNSLVSKHWNHITTPEVLYFSRGWYCFRFLCKEDMESVQLDSWNINGYPLVFKPWSPTVAEELSVVISVPVWVLFPNLDPCFWSQSALSKVASFVGRPICTDEPTTNKSKIAFARILVEVDLSQDLPKGMCRYPNIEYEWVPHFCHTCKKIGHTQDRCNRNKPKQVYKPKLVEPAVVVPVVSKVQDEEGTADTVVSPLANKYSALVIEVPVTVCIGVEQEAIHEVGQCIGKIYGDRLRYFSMGHQIPWACLGDFNVSLSADERLGCFAFLPAGVSDHSPILMNVNPPVRDCVHQGWQLNTHGGRIYSLFCKLRNLRKDLKALHCSEFSGLKTRVAVARDKLNDCQIQIQASPLNTLLLAQEKECIQVYTKLKQAEMRVLNQTAKVKHLQLSDQNSKYFYAHLKSRKLRNTIGVIEDTQGTLHTGHTQALFAQQTLNTFEPLIAPVTHQEIKEALFSIYKDKSPRVDVLAFFEKGPMPRAANSTVITLIPKTDSPKTVVDFRPISCCTVYYKTVSKILANRMKHVLGEIIGLEQAAFIKRRDLFDNSMLAHELAFRYNRSLISPRCILKIDIKKAFDSVHWGFLDDCLRLFQFPPQFIKWILACVTTSHISLNINGINEGFFPGKRGLRQGDPLSPYLFTICMEVLSRLLRNLPVAPDFFYHPKCVKIHLTHLVFADDLLVFTRGDLPSVRAVKSCLEQFASYSGLRANPMKMSLYLGGVLPSLKALILSATGFVEGSFPVKYLDIPLFHARLTEPMFAPLLDKIKTLIGHWATNSLSYAGRTHLLIRSSLG
ncbi:uncharacterized protein LOC141649045 [Silene latifolia]|uniref:uncharacterized protein LOC141649045 n=1 Tax=Silene latifolia TaxID=37657 RepID=UPI003D77C1B9